MVECQQCSNRVQCSRSSIAVTQHGSWDTHGKTRQFRAKAQVECLCLTLIGRGYGSPIQAEVCNILWAHVPFLHRQLYSTSILDAAGRRSYQPMSVIGLPIADNFAIDGCPTLLCMLVVL